MNIESWLEQYGYLAVFLGVFFEGPMTMTLSGFLVYQGYLNMFVVFITAFMASFLMAEILYFIGLIAGRLLLARWPAWREHYTRFSALISRYQAFFILVYRFFYGTQVVASITIGMIKIRPAYFTVMNAAGAALWTLAFFLVGYFFGHTFTSLIDDIKRYEKPLSLVLVAAVLIYYLAHRFVRRRISKEKKKASI